MPYKIVYHEAHEDDSMKTHIHIYLSGSKEEISAAKRELEKILGENLDKLTKKLGGDIYENGTNYKIPAKLSNQHYTLIKKLADTVGIKNLSSKQLEELKFFSRLADTLYLDPLLPEFLDLEERARLNWEGGFLLGYGRGIPPWRKW